MALLVVGLVLGPVALEPGHLGVALEGEDMRGDAVQEPAIMANHHGAAGKPEDRLLQALEGLDVEVVGRLIEEQQVAGVHQGLGHKHAVSHAARELRQELLLVGPHEVEEAAIGAGIHFALADLDFFGSAGDLLKHRILVVERLAPLLHGDDLHRLAELEGAGIRRFLPEDHLEEGGLAGAVGADDAHDPRARKREGEVLVKTLFAKTLGDAVCLNHHVAQPLAVRDLDLGRLHGVLAFLRKQLLVSLEAGLGLRLAGLGVRLHPLLLLGQALGAVRF